MNLVQSRVGLFAGGIESYWKDCGMDALPASLESDIQRLKVRLEKHCQVVYPFMVRNEAEARQAGKVFRDQNVDMVLMYHATYVDDAMTLALIEEITGIYPVLYLSQGLPGIPDMLSLTEAATCWGVNSAVQLPGSFKRLWKEFPHGFVFGNLENERSYSEVLHYARAARAVKQLRGKKVGILPHRSAAIPMYDTYPDEARLMGQTGIKISYLYSSDLARFMGEVSELETKQLTDELYEQCEVVEPPFEEVFLAARQAIALERLVNENRLDALAIDMAPGLTPQTGMIPAVGMARLIDQGIVVASEGDLSVAVSGLLIRELCGKPIQHWEHAIFDEEKNWLLGGHEGGSAGFQMAKTGTRPKLRNTQYINFGKTPGAPYHGVLPEFITNPGPVTLLTLFRDEDGYQMRLARGISVDTFPREVHFEHTIFQPNIPLQQYFRRIDQIGVCHHFALVHAEISQEVEKAAAILQMNVEYLTD